jgi:hypothetical protein
MAQGPLKDCCIFKKKKKKKNPKWNKLLLFFLNIFCDSVISDRLAI